MSAPADAAPGVAEQAHDAAGAPSVTKDAPAVESTAAAAAAVEAPSASASAPAEASPAVSSASASDAAASSTSSGWSLPADTKHTDFTLHVSHPPVLAEVLAACSKLKHAVLASPAIAAHSAEAEKFLTVQNLHRYLRARQFDHAKSTKLLQESLAWRLTYKPHEITAAEVEAECKTGKIRVLPDLDRHQRPIIVMDSSRENSKNHDSQLRHLTWQLERASRKMNVPVAGQPAPDAADPSSPAAYPHLIEKYCLFINMERNSLWNSPPMKTSMETLKTLTERFPEHLGHAVVYKPGLLFNSLWSACKVFMDAKTVRKVLFISGDVSDGSKNDLLLKDIIGDKWREWCDCPKDAYNHATFWPQVLEDEAKWNEAHPKPAADAAVEPAAQPAPAAAVAAQ